MADEVTVFETFFRAELLTVAEVVTCVGQRIFNSLAPPKAEMPYAVFKVIPLEDNTGQARTLIQTRLIVDLKIVTTPPPPTTVTLAIAAAKEHFRDSLTFDADGFRISVRHERPISFVEPGATAEERLLNRGGSFRVWMSKV